MEDTPTLAAPPRTAQSHPAAATRLVARPASALRGVAAVPGDKSISHRAVILAAAAVGESRIRGLLQADDVTATVAAMRQLGATVYAHGPDHSVVGPGIGALAEPAAVLDMGNSGTGARLLAGFVATHPIITFFSGDASLSARPMQRVTEPLTAMGATIWTRSGGRLPMAVRGSANPLPITYELPVASAQVKSAVLLAALNTPGRTSVIEPAPSRDHTELMLGHFGADIAVEALASGGRRISLMGQPELTAREIEVPGDLSSAAFPLVAALIVPKSKVRLQGVGINPLRSGLIETLLEMGARIDVVGRRFAGREAVADLVVEAGPLQGVEVPAGRAPAMIDEYPILAVAAACASGATRMTGIRELRVKESDRLSAMAKGLAACGIAVEEGEDWLQVIGAAAPPAGGAEILTGLDHRIAMAFLVLGSASRNPVAIDDAAPIRTSFPGFAALMNALGTRIEPCS